MECSPLKSRTNNVMVLVCAVATFLPVVVHSVFDNVGLSTFLTLPLYILALALVILHIFVQNQQSVAGVSLRMLELQGLSSALRLCCTSWLNGYIPVDSTGDGIYQLLDVIIILLVLKIMHDARYRYPSTYSAAHDTFPHVMGIAFCFVLSSLTHPNLNRRVLFDILWSTSLNLDSISVLPQIWMMSRNRSSVSAYTSHYVFAVVLSRLTSLFFWYHGYVELRSNNFSYAGEVVMFAHIFSFIAAGDFVYHYVSAVARSITADRFNFSSTNV